MTANRLDGLDGLRGIAALLVVIYHVGRSFRLPELQFAGYLAVDFFFMLSGYVMARTYEARLREGWSPSAFMTVRIKRLWPIAACGMLFGLPLLMAQFPDHWFGLLALNLLLLPAPVTPVFPVNSPVWSILAELFANVVHCFILFRLSTRKLVLFAIGFAALLLLVALPEGTINQGWDFERFRALVPRVLAPYAIGIILYRTWKDRPPVRIPVPVTVAILPATMLFESTVVGDMLFVLVLCPVLLAGGLQWNAPRVAQILGAMSFAIYAVHYPLLDLAHFWPVAAFLIFPIAYLLTPSIWPPTFRRFVGEAKQPDKVAPS